MNSIKIIPFLCASLLCGHAAEQDYQTYELNHSMYKKGWIDFNKNGKKDIYEDPTQSVDARVEDLLSQMNLDEKSCQMATLYGYQRVLKDDLPNESWKTSLWKDGIGAIDEHLNGFTQWGAPPSTNPYVWPASKHAWALNEVQRFFIEETRLGIPTDFTNEGIRGVESFKATNFPNPLGIGHTWNRELVHKVGLITGKEAQLLGYTNIYAPILDVGRDQRWGRYEEIYGESPYIVAELGTQMAKGVQHDYQVACTAKHFIAYSNNKGAREGISRTDPQMSPREVERLHVPGFKRVIRDAKILGVMSSYNDYNSEPIQSSHYWLTERLRDDFGFTGYVVSDSDAVEFLHTKHCVSGNMKESVRQSVEAGLNVRCTFLPPDGYVLPIRELVKEGGLSMDVVDSRVRDILRVKFTVGLFDEPYRIDLKEADRVVECDEHQAVARQASHESLVLLKNKDKALPLDKAAIKTIAVCGPNADEVSFALTRYGPNSCAVTSTLQGIKNKLGSGAKVLYSKGCDLVDPNWPESEIMDFPITAKESEGIAQAVKDAEQADVVVAVVGGGIRTCGENKSRSDITLPGRQEELLKALKATGKPLIVVLINGRPLAVNWAEANADAILEAWYPGAFGGEAVANVLFGDYNPGGKLTVTFPKHVGQIPFNFPTLPMAQANGGTRPGLKGSQSRVNGALYDFGHGLSYTTFKYSDLKVETPRIKPDEDVQVSFTITNTGDREGDEIAQLYIRDVLSTVTTYEKNLCNFERVHLKAGESKRIHMTIKGEDMALLNREDKWVVEEGEFKVMVGASSSKILLNGSYEVLDGSAAASTQKKDSIISASANKADAEKALDGKPETSWKGNQGEYVTVTLATDAELKEVSLTWSAASEDARFIIQLSSGGGQYLDVFTGDIKELNKAIKCAFPAESASNMRVLISKGTASLSEMEYK